MSDDRQKNTPERENRIRERAYHLWQADGCPDGREQEYLNRPRKARNRAAERWQLTSAEFASLPHMRATRAFRRRGCQLMPRRQGVSRRLPSMDQESANEAGAARSSQCEAAASAARIAVSAEVVPP